MDYTKLKNKEPISYGVTSLPDALDVNNYVNPDYLCENPWSVKGIEAEPWKPWIEVDKNSLSEIISQAVHEVIKEKNLLVTPEIEKYHLKHR
jgi:hypothetical protein